jgi:hypothetical protein
VCVCQQTSHQSEHHWRVDKRQGAHKVVVDLVDGQRLMALTKRHAERFAEYLTVRRPWEE